MNNNTLPKPPAQLSVDETASITKRPSENDMDSTLPNPAGKPSSNLRQEGFPDGSVMWDGPEPLGEGARSAVPCIPQAKTIDPAKAVTDPAEAGPMSVSGVGFAPADPQKSRAFISISDEGLAKATRMLDSIPTPKPTLSVSVSSVNDRKSDSANAPKFESESETVHEKMDANDSLILHPGMRKWEAYQNLRNLGVHDPEAANDSDIQSFEALFVRCLHQLRVLASARRSAAKPAPDGQVPDQKGTEAPEPLLSTEQKAEAFSIIKVVRTTRQEIDAVRAYRKDTEPGETTIADYQKRLKYLEPLFEHTVSKSSRIPWTDTFDMLNVSKSTFSQYRSAIKWGCTARLTKLLAAQDQMQRTQGQSLQWYRDVKALEEIWYEYQEICSLSYDEYRGQEDWPPARLKKTHAKHSKKLALKNLPDGWQERFVFVNEQSPTYRFAGVMLRYCGMRPAELERGVQVKWTEQGAQVVIQGAKVRDTAGQPWRSFLLNPKLLPQWFVDELKEHGTLNISAISDNMRTHLQRLSETVFNPEQRKNGCKETLSAYIFRHALVTEMRESGWTSEEMAAVIGEWSAETIRHYGTRVRGGKKIKPDVVVIKDSVQTARPVKPADTQELQNLKNRKPAQPD
ncbi:hypothetical protein [Comamonas resistens]|uniref:hypothetical protein n=1 Tax=Comamonas resistens TaxID=3046670 RepID=UPI0039BCF837